MCSDINVEAPSDWWSVSSNSADECNPASAWTRAKLSTFRLGNLRAPCAANLTEWIYTDGQADLKHVPPVQKTVNEKSHKTSSRGCGTALLKAFSWNCWLDFFGPFQRKIFDWTLKLFQKDLLLSKYSGDFNQRQWKYACRNQWAH